MSLRLDSSGQIDRFLRRRVALERLSLIFACVVRKLLWSHFDFLELFSNQTPSPVRWRQSSPWELFGLALCHGGTLSMFKTSSCLSSSKLRWNRLWCLNRFFMTGSSPFVRASSCLHIGEATCPESRRGTSIALLWCWIRKGFINWSHLTQTVISWGTNYLSWPRAACWISNCQFEQI